jgi:hypothetical protein
MEIGFTDILLVLIIGVVGILMFRGKVRKAVQPEIKIRRPTAAELEKERIKKGGRLRLRVLAGILMVIGIALLLGTLGVLKLLTLSYVWSGILIIGGTVLLFWSTRR